MTNRIDAASEADLTYRGLVIIAETLAEAGYEMTFRPVKYNLPSAGEAVQKVTFEPSEEALLRLNRLDDTEPLRQIDYDRQQPNNWSDFCRYFTFLLSRLFRDDESNTIEAAIADRVFDLAIRNSPGNNPMSSRLRPLTDITRINLKHQSKYEAYTAQYAAQISEVNPQIESFPRGYVMDETKGVNGELLAWINSPYISQNTDLRIRAGQNDSHLNDETVNALLASPKFHVVRRLTLSQIYLSRQSLEKIVTLPNLVYLEISGGSYSDWAGPNYISPTLKPEDIEFLRMHERANPKLDLYLYNQEEDGHSLIGAY